MPWVANKKKCTQEASISKNSGPQQRKDFVATKKWWTSAGAAWWWSVKKIFFNNSEPWTARSMNKNKKSNILKSASRIYTNSTCAGFNFAKKLRSSSFLSNYQTKMKVVTTDTPLLHRVTSLIKFIILETSSSSHSFKDCEILLDYKISCPLYINGLLFALLRVLLAVLMFCMSDFTVLSIIWPLFYLIGSCFCESCSFNYSLPTPFCLFNIVFLYSSDS